MDISDRYDALRREVREAAKAFKEPEDWPDAWLYLSDDPMPGAQSDWYDFEIPLLNRPVYHCPAYLRHSGYDGEHQKIVPLWLTGDPADPKRLAMVREFEARLAKSGDFE